MELHALTDQLSVSPQIEIEDLPQLAAAGFAVVIDNRPDSEIGADLSSARMAEAAAAAGLAFHYLPVVPGQMTADLVRQLTGIVDATEGKVLAYCRSGTRSATAWALGQAGRRPGQDILRMAAAAGYDLSGIAPYLR